MFFILNKLSDITGNHSYVTDLVIRNLTITKENFEAICESFCNITSLSLIDCQIEFTEAIAKLPLKEVSLTNCGFDDKSLEHLNQLDELEILNFIDLVDLDLHAMTIVSKVANLSLIYDTLVDSVEAIESVRASYLDIRGTEIDNSSLLLNTNLKTLIASEDDEEIFPTLRNMGVTIKIEKE